MRMIIMKAIACLKCFSNEERYSAIAHIWERMDGLTQLQTNVTHFSRYDICKPHLLHKLRIPKLICLNTATVLSIVKRKTNLSEVSLDTEHCIRIKKNRCCTEFLLSNWMF